MPTLAIRTALALAAAGTLVAVTAQQSGQSPEELFQRVRAKVLADLGRIPNYTCVQTTTRIVSVSRSGGFRLCDQIMDDRREPASVRQVSRERLRLDVAIAGGREVYSWVGASKFEDSSLHDLIGYGHTSTGDFGPFLSSLFSSNPPMKFTGERTVDGRRLFEYSYEMPLALSSYKVKAGPVEFITAYSGTILIDPSSEELVRLTADSAPLPAKSGYCGTENSLEYGRVRIGQNNALVPVEGRANAIDDNGDEMLNINSYSGCREYVGESSVRFDSPDDSGGDSALNGGKNGPAEATSIAPDSRFSARIVTQLDSDTSAMGDPIEAVLRTPLTDEHRHTIAKSGARIHGRLTRFALNSAGAKDQFEVGVQFLAIDVEGRTIPLRAHLAANAGPANANSDDARQGIGRFQYVGSRLHLKQIDANWITIQAPEQRN